MTIDISDFYLMTPLKRPELIRISINDIPEEIIIKYKLREIADSKGMVYIQANRGMYGLPQSGLLANELLEKRLNKRGYHQSKLVPGLWSHKWRPVQFTLVIDDFGVKYVGEEHTQDKKFIQQVCGKCLFLGQAVDSTLLCPISAIPSQAAKPTKDTMEQTLQLLDYIATQEEAVLTYSASDMKLAVHSDASYLSEPQACSRAGGHFFFSNKATIPANNGAVLNIAHIIKHVMTSATEAELAALYIMAREAVYIRIVLTEMGHKQSSTPLQTDNTTVEAVCNGKIQPK